MPTPLSPENTRTTLIHGKRVYLVKVAKAQRVLIFLVVALLLINFGGIFLLVTFRASLPPSLTWQSILPVLLTVNAALAIAAIVQTVRLALASGTHIAVAIIAGVFLLIPWLGLLVVVFINVYATKVLTSNAVAVGFFGVTAAEMKKLVIGACTHCGYDIRGLPPSPAPQCPECGTPIPPTAQAESGMFTPANS